jgi:hypothetical protein
MREYAFLPQKTNENITERERRIPYHNRNNIEWATESGLRRAIKEQFEEQEAKKRRRAAFSELLP